MKFVEERRTIGEANWLTQQSTKNYGRTWEPRPGHRALGVALPVLSERGRIRALGLLAALLLTGRRPPLAAHAVRVHCQLTLSLLHQEPQALFCKSF